MSSYIKPTIDPILSGMSHRLPTLRFPESIIIPNPGKSFKNCYLNLTTMTWIVRFSIGGVQRTVGIAKHEGANRERAVRFTDMFVLFFWPYRNPGQAMRDSCFNISIEQATKDLETCTMDGQVPAKRWLEAIEKHWLSINAISAPTTQPTGGLEAKYFYPQARHAWNRHRKFLSMIPGNDRTKFVLQTLRESADQYDKLIASYERLISSENNG